MGFKNVVSFLANRAMGVEYGAVRVAGGKAQLVKTEKLNKLVDNIRGDLGGTCERVINPEEYNRLVRRMGPLAKNAEKSVDSRSLEYCQAHGATQVFDRTNNCSLVDIRETVRSPIRFFLKYC